MKPPFLFILFFTLIFAPTFAITEEAQTEYPIVILISPPRSLSTAFLRMISARGDFTCFHEYFTTTYAQKHETVVVHDWLRADTVLPKTFEAITKLVLEKAKTSPVFVKEMSIPMLDFLSHESEFIKRQNVYLLFLVRNPHPCTISYYNGLSKKIIKNFSSWLGFEATYKVFKITQETAHNKPLIIQAEDLYTQPEQAAKLLCKHLNIPFTEAMLNWPKLEENFTGIQEWGELKNKEQTDNWHGNAIRTTHFKKQKSYDIDGQGNPTFNEIANPEDKATCRKAYEEHMPYYQLLLAETDNLLIQPSLKKETSMTPHTAETPKYLYKILTLELWEASKKEANLLLSPNDTDFIHFSKEDQIAGTVAKRFANIPHVIVKIETSKLVGKLVFEPNPGKEEKYYHLYDGFIPMSAVAEHTKK